MDFDFEVPGNRQWKFFPAKDRLAARKAILDSLDKRRRQERDPMIGATTERRLLDYELADLDVTMTRFMAVFKRSGQ